MTAPRYSRGELARLEKVLRRLAAECDEEAGALEKDDDRDPPDVKTLGLAFAIENRELALDLRQAADFLAETVAVLDAQARRRRSRAAQEAIDAKKRRGRRG